MGPWLVSDYLRRDCSECSKGERSSETAVPGTGQRRNRTSTVGELRPFSNWLGKVPSNVASKAGYSCEMPATIRACRGKTSPNVTLRRLLPDMPGKYRGSVDRGRTPT